MTLSQLIEWLLREREDDQLAFESFLVGRRDEARVWDGDSTPAAREAMRPFAAHPILRVREWAEYRWRGSSATPSYFKDSTTSVAAGLTASIPAGRAGQFLVHVSSNGATSRL